MVAAWVEGRTLPSQLWRETTAWDAAAVDRLLDTHDGRSNTAEPTSNREGGGGATPVERVSANDLLHLAVGASTVPSQIAALLWTRPTRPFDIDAARAVIGERVDGVRRLRQRLESAPLGCGRPFWVDVAAFDVAAHVAERACPAPGDDRALLDVAAEVLTTPLDTSRPLWRMVYVTGLADGRVAVILVLHHVVADGIGGLEVLARLVDDGADAGPAPTSSRPRPTRRQLCVDALAERWRALRRVPTVLARLPAALQEMGAGSGGPTPRTSLNRATGPTRRFAIVRWRLDDARQAAHAHAATVNDVLLTATTGALGELLRRRGENVGALTVSVPVAAQGAVARSALGNRVGIRRVTVPLAGDPIVRLGAIAAASHAAATPQPAASADLIGPLFRLLSVTGVLRWFIDHQRLTNTLVANLHGPPQPLSLAGDAITEAAGLNVAGGNLAVTFTALSYAGALVITVSADPDLIPDVDRLAADVDAQLRHICAPPDVNSPEGP
jgi:WS/DGAT/MGAT family acyltransferase